MCAQKTGKSCHEAGRSRPPASPRRARGSVAPSPHLRPRPRGSGRTQQRGGARRWRPGETPGQASGPQSPISDPGGQGGKGPARPRERTAAMRWERPLLGSVRAAVTVSRFADRAPPRLVREVQVPPPLPTGSIHKTRGLGGPRFRCPRGSAAPPRSRSFSTGAGGQDTGPGKCSLPPITLPARHRHRSLAPSPAPGPGDSPASGPPRRAGIGAALRGGHSGLESRRAQGHPAP